MNFAEMLLKPPVEAMRVWNNPRFTADDKEPKPADHEPRRCKVCNTVKPAEAFRPARNTRGVMYIRGDCRECELEAQRRNRAKKKGRKNVST